MVAIMVLIGDQVLHDLLHPFLIYVGFPISFGWGCAHYVMLS